MNNVIPLQRFLIEDDFRITGLHVASLPAVSPLTFSIGNKIKSSKNEKTNAGNGLRSFTDGSTDFT